MTDRFLKFDKLVFEEIPFEDFKTEKGMALRY